MILDSYANLVSLFHQEAEARAALEQIVHQDPDSADEYALFQYDDRGNPVGAALSGAELGVHA